MIIILISILVLSYLGLSEEDSSLPALGERELEALLGVHAAGGQGAHAPRHRAHRPARTPHQAADWNGNIFAYIIICK